MKRCSAWAAAAASAALAWSFAASGQGAGSSQDQLEQVCREEGASAEICTCYGDFISENFTDREMAGAVAVFTDPSLAEDRENPPETVSEWFDTLGAISDKVEALGISQAEMFAVFFRVLELSETAMDVCEAQAP